MLISNDNYKLKILISSILFSFLFTRILVLNGFPSLINHFHYLLVFLLYLFSFILIMENTTSILNKTIFLLFFIILISTLINSVSKFNLFIYMLIILEPFLYYCFLIKINLKLSVQKFLRNFLLFFGLLNSLTCYIQYFILNLKHDNVQGLFINLGAGHHVSGAIATLTASYIFFALKFNNYFKLFIILFLLIVNILSDSKQVVLSFIIVTILFYLIKILKHKNFFYFIKIILNTSLLLVFFYIFFLLYKNYFAPYYSKNLEEILLGLELKFKVIEIIDYYHTSFLNKLFGLGPGQSTSRLSIMIPDYQNMSFFNFSINDLTNFVWVTQQSNYVTNITTGSSLFSLFFFWGGIYGDIGLGGSLIYIFFWYLILKKNKFDDYSIFLVILVFLKGLIFNWPEEPPFILFVVSLLVLRFYEIKKNENITNT